jgi:hypothetical protein
MASRDLDDRSDGVHNDLRLVNLRDVAGPFGDDQTSPFRQGGLILL